MRFKGLRGLISASDKRQEEQVVRGASIVYLDIGKNDLAKMSCDPMKFARDLCSNTDKIIIGQILFREALT